MRAPWIAGVGLALAGALPGTALTPGQAPTFSTRVEAVRVDVLVTDQGRPVRGLAASDFEVLDNGVRQQVDLASFEQIPLNVVLALDMSASVAGERLDHLVDAGHALLDALTTADQAALVTFNQQVTLGAALTKDINRVRAALAATRPTGQTAVIDGCFAGMLLGESDVGRALLIVFSDGLDTSSWLSPARVLETAKRSDVVVYTVAAGRAGSAAFLKDLSRFTGGTLVEVESTKDVAAVFLKVLEEFRHRYLVSYSPRGVAREGWHELEVRVRERRATVKARPGYFAR